MAALMQSVSGIRGIVGKTFTPAVITRSVAAFGALQKRHKVGHSAEPQIIFLGRDSRVSGPWVEQIAAGVLAAQGYHVKLVGIVPTPTVQLLVIKEKAVGGLIITSSHNPVEWNGLKFVDIDGIFLDPELCTQLFALAANSAKLETSFEEWNKAGKLEVVTHAIDSHLESIFDLPYINTETVGCRKYKVCLDAINGAGGEIMKRLLEKFGCEVVMLNGEPTGIFSHEPEPIPANLNQLSQAVKEHNAHFGIAVDPDVDRCVLIDEHGIPLGEEYTLAIAVDYMLGRVGLRGAVVKNLSTSRVIDDIAAKYECEVLSTPVGEIHVAKEMVKSKAVIGGEGNGGVMLPDVHIGRDAPVAAALVLMHLSIEGSSLSQLKAKMPQWEIVKLKTPTTGLNLSGALESIKDTWRAKGAAITESDGIRIDAEDFWVHMRASNTEPIVRVIGESSDSHRATLRCSDFMEQIQMLGRTEEEH
jgi:phosphomannomutase